MLNSRGTCLVASAVFALFVSAGGVYAQSERPPLRGPDVKDASPPGEKNSFVRGGKDRKDQAAERGGPLQMMRAINSLRAPETPENLRLSPEQDQQLRGIMDASRDEIRAFREAHGEEIRGLVRALSPEARKKVADRLRPFLGAEPGAKGRGPEAGGPGERRGPGEPGGPEGDRPRARKPKGDQPPPGDDRPMDEMRSGDAPKDDGAAMARLKELADQAPDFKAAETKAWNVLTDPQQAYVKGRMEEMRKEVEQRRLDNPPQKAKDKAERKVEKKLDRKLDKKLDAAPGAADGRENLRERIPPELREKLRDMSPEERREAVRKWMEENGGGKAPKNPK